MNPDGSGYDIQTLGDPDLSFGCPAWEPGDAHLACEGWDENDPGVVAHMYRISVASWAGLTQLTTNPYGGHDIPEDYSPDGTRIAFDREDPARGEAALHVLDLETGAIHRIGEWQRELPHASWSPNGRRILTYDGDGNLLTMRPDGTRKRIMPLRVAALSFAFVPGWSPDGTRIVFSDVHAPQPARYATARHLHRRVRRQRRAARLSQRGLQRGARRLGPRDVALVLQVIGCGGRGEAVPATSTREIVARARVASRAWSTPASLLHPWRAVATGSLSPSM